MTVEQLTAEIIPRGRGKPGPAPSALPPPAPPLPSGRHPASPRCPTSPAHLVPSPGRAARARCRCPLGRACASGSGAPVPPVPVRCACASGALVPPVRLCLHTRDDLRYAGPSHRSLWRRHRPGRHQGRIADTDQEIRREPGVSACRDSLPHLSMALDDRGAIEMGVGLHAQPALRGRQPQRWQSCATPSGPSCTRDAAAGESIRRRVRRCGAHHRLWAGRRPRRFSGARALPLSRRSRVREDAS